MSFSFAGKTAAGEPNADEARLAPGPGDCERPRRWRFLRSEKSGSAVIEFAILAIPFFVIIFAIIETGLLFLAELTLDQAVDIAARSVRTGEVQKANLSEAAFRQKLCDRVSFLLKCDKLIVDLSTYTDFSKIPTTSPIANGDINSTGFGYSPGAAETINALRVYYKWTITTPALRPTMSNMSDGSMLISSTAAFRTEPF